MNPDLLRLNPYPFERIRHLLDGIPAAESTNIALSLGEPKHHAPDFVLKAVTDNWSDIEKYPPTRGSSELRGKYRELAGPALSTGRRRRQSGIPDIAGQWHPRSPVCDWPVSVGQNS